MIINSPVIDNMDHETNNHAMEDESSPVSCLWNVQQKVSYKINWESKNKQNIQKLLIPV